MSGELLHIQMDVDDLVRNLKDQYPKDVDRAAWGAMGSVGYQVTREVQKQIRGGFGWPRKSTKFLRKKGMSWWAKFIKYRRFRGGEGGTSRTAGSMGVVILPLKDDKVQGASVSGSQYSVMRERDSKFLKAVFHRFEHGRDIPVSKAMRGKMAARNAASGKGLLIKKSTTTLHFAPRPIFGPAWRRQQHWAPAAFTNFFFDNLSRYQSGLSVRAWKALGKTT